MNYWERRDKLFKYTGGTRQFFPLAQEQLETVSRIIDTYNKDKEHRQFLFDAIDTSKHLP